jgi:hypothetical protein
MLQTLDLVAKRHLTDRSAGDVKCAGGIADLTTTFAQWSANLIPVWGPSTTFKAYIPAVPATLARRITPPVFYSLSPLVPIQPRRFPVPCG